MFWQPNGAAVRNVIETFWREVHVARGYSLLYTPHIAKTELWKTSGHYDFYGENMFEQIKARLAVARAPCVALGRGCGTVRLQSWLRMLTRCEPAQVEDEEYQLRPMNCPFHVLTYKEGRYSYRDLPLRWAELGTVYRYERSGTMHGLFRVRGFTQVRLRRQLGRGAVAWLRPAGACCCRRSRAQAFTSRPHPQDDAHIFCLPEQIEAEIGGVLQLVEDVLGRFGFREYEINLSTRPESSIGDDAVWERAEGALVSALNAKGCVSGLLRCACHPRCCRCHAASERTGHSAPVSTPAAPHASRLAGGRSKWMRAAARSMAPRLTSRSVTQSAAAGSAAPSSWTSTCRNASRWSTSTATTCGSGLS